VPIGHYLVELLGEAPPGHPYPSPTSYIAILAGEVTTFDRAPTGDDCIAAELCHPATVASRTGTRSWFALYRRVLALRA